MATSGKEEIHCKRLSNCLHLFSQHFSDTAQPFLYGHLPIRTLNRDVISCSTLKCTRWISIRFWAHFLPPPPNKIVSTLTCYMFLGQNGGISRGVVVRNLYTDPKISGPCPLFSDSPVTGKFPDVSILYSKQQSIIQGQVCYFIL